MARNINPKTVYYNAKMVQLRIAQDLLGDEWAGRRDLRIEVTWNEETRRMHLLLGDQGYRVYYPQPFARSPRLGLNTFLRLHNMRPDFIAPGEYSATTIHRTNGTQIVVDFSKEPTSPRYSLPTAEPTAQPATPDLTSAV